MTDYSGFLFAEPSILEGVGRIMDLGATMIDYNLSPTGAIADALAFKADEMALAADAARVRTEFLEELKDRIGTAAR